MSLRKIAANWAIDGLAATIAVLQQAFTFQTTDCGAGHNARACGPMLLADGESAYTLVFLMETKDL